MSDKEIIRLLRDRPSEGLYEAIEKYGRLVRAIVRRILHNHPQDAEECAEDTFVNIWRQSGSIDADTPHFKAYILSAARNIAITRYRQLARNPVVPLDSVPEPLESDIVEHILRAEEDGEIRKLILEMDEPERGIFFRRFFLFESYRQVARAMELSEVQVKNTLYRKKTWLKKKLEERGVSLEANG